MPNWPKLLSACIESAHTHRAIRLQLMPAKDLSIRACATRAGHQRRLLLGALACSCLAGAAWAREPGPGPGPANTAERLSALLPAHALLLGEQHDAPEHQRIAEQAVDILAAQGRLAALVLEMLPAGARSASMPPNSTPEAVRQALNWDDAAWPWVAYGPVVMAAIKAGSSVLGGNLPVGPMRQAMTDAGLDARLPPAALAEQRQLMRDGHCGLLPESQIAPMARIQIARDLSMAAAVQSAVQGAQAGHVVLMLSGSVHADKRLGVPMHLPAELQIRSVRLLAGGQAPASGPFDAYWQTAPAPPTDHCAQLRERFKSAPPRRSP